MSVQSSKRNLDQMFVWQLKCADSSMSLTGHNSHVQHDFPMSQSFPSKADSDLVPAMLKSDM